MFTDLYKTIEIKLKKAQNVLIISHREPDADTIGGAGALKFVCDSWGVRNTIACIDTPPENLKFMPYVNEFVDSFNLADFDEIVIVDSGAYYMTNFHLKYKDLFNNGRSIINIDHHASNENFGTVNFVDVDAPSVTCMVYDLLKAWKIAISEDVATALLAGIYGDTGCFMHSNSTKRVFEISSDLMSLGANVTQIVKSLFRNNSVSTLKLWGRVFENSTITDGGVVVSVIKDDDFVASGSDMKQLSGVVDYLSMVPKTKFSILLNEDLEGNVRGSLRTRRDGVDLSRIARVFGGGGHAGASGFTVPGRLADIPELG